MAYSLLDKHLELMRIITFSQLNALCKRYTHQEK